MGNVSKSKHARSSGGIRKIETSAANVEEMCTNVLSKAINMSPGNYSNAQGKVIGDWEEIEKLYNSEECIAAIKGRLATFQEMGSVGDFDKWKALAGNSKRKSDN